MFLYNVGVYFKCVILLLSGWKLQQAPFSGRRRSLFETQIDILALRIFSCSRFKIQFEFLLGRSSVSSGNLTLYLSYYFIISSNQAASMRGIRRCDTPPITVPTKSGQGWGWVVIVKIKKNARGAADFRTIPLRLLSLSLSQYCPTGDKRRKKYDDYQLFTERRAAGQLLTPSTHPCLFTKKRWRKGNGR